MDSDYQDAVQNNVQSKLSKNELPDDICFQNNGQTLKKSKLLPMLESIKNKKLPDSIFDGNKSDVTLYVKRTNFEHGPGAMKDDKGAYLSQTHGQNVYAYLPVNGDFKKAISGHISTKGNIMTYKKGNEICPVEDDWVIIKTSYCTRQKDGLKRYTTYFNTQNTQYLWINSIAVCEYIGKDLDEHSNLDPHMRSKYKDEPYRAQDKAAMSEALKMKEAGVPARKVLRQYRNVTTPSKGLNSPKKLYEAYSRSKKKLLGPSFGGSGSEQALKVFVDMQLGDEHVSGGFVKDFYCDSKGKPSFVCYEPWQIKYTKRMCRFNYVCCSPIHEDKTYNMCDCFLTQYAYLSTDFVRADDMVTHPIIPGKMIKFITTLTVRILWEV